MRIVPKLLIAALIASAFITQASSGAPPFSVQSGWVHGYAPGSTITIEDGGFITTYQLAPQVRIIPPKKADELAIGTWVTVRSRHDPATDIWMVFSIRIVPAPAAPTPTP